MNIRNSSDCKLFTVGPRSYATAVALAFAIALTALATGCAGITAAGPTSPATDQTIALAVSPADAIVQTGATQQFTATVAGSSNAAVTWSATSGTVSNSGLYTAPSTPGTYSITATSGADPTKSASATVTVSTTVTHALSVSSTSIDFENILTSSTASQNLTLSNTGPQSVTISAANFTGGVFSATGLSLPLTIAAGATKTVTINFTPAISGPYSGSVSLVSDATNSPATVSLSGSGVASQPHSVDLGWVGSTSTGVIGYYVYRSTVSGSGYVKLNAISVAPTTTYTDSTVQSGASYFYVVTAVDGSGNESTFSNESVATIPSP